MEVSFSLACGKLIEVISSKSNSVCALPIPFHFAVCMPLLNKGRSIPHVDRAADSISIIWTVLIRSRLSEVRREELIGTQVRKKRRAQWFPNHPVVSSDTGITGIASLVSLSFAPRIKVVGRSIGLAHERAQQ
jgi:hypothetical protein